MTSTATMNLEAIIESITCPITQEPMVDPVQAKDGHTYEREAIVHALQVNPLSPMTREQMTATDLKVNPSIRFLCDKYHSGAFGVPGQVPRAAPKISTDDIQLVTKISKNDYDTMMLSFEVDPETFPNGHLSQDVVVVIDHSGSMNAAVEAQDKDGNSLENGFSVQDIVNHAAKTVAKTLDKNSRLSVVIFDNRIEMLFDLMLMTEMNCTQALSQITQISPGGQTNLWGGIECAIGILDKREDKSRNSAILVFTDGVPNLSPSRGEVETMQKLRNKKNFTAPVYTFGFGYNLKQDLLYDLAKYANGGNGHIPDGGLIASVFCNFISTILTTVVMNLQLHIKMPDEEMSSVDFIMGDFPSKYDPESKCTIYDLGTVQHQQSRDIVFKTNSSSNFTFFYTYKIGGRSCKSDTFTVDSTMLSLQPISTNTNIQINRCYMVECIRSMINYNRLGDNENAMKIYHQLDEKLSKCGLGDPLTTGLIDNLKGDGKNLGQIFLAVSNMTYFKRWGEFYLDQLSRSLNQQMKPNFKDKGCQFGGEVFEDIVDRASDIFDSLPPTEPSLNKPKPSYGGYGAYGSSAPAPPPRPPVNMAAYNDPSGGCFDSNCLVTMADGNTKALKYLTKNDMIQSVDKEGKLVSAKVICILERKISSGVRQMVEFEDGLFITPWHPIKYNGKWVFPVDLKDPINKDCNSIITLVLDSYHVGIINGIQCIMLGHGFTNGILNHPYLGTNLIIDDMRKMPGWDIGHIVLVDNWIIKENDLVSRIIYTPPTIEVC